MKRIETCIRTIPDFPKSGVQFKDLTPLLKNPAALRLAVHELVRPYLGRPLSAVAACEARGFIFGSLAAWELGLPLIPLRRPGKLPAATRRVEYQLEYGRAALTIHRDALEQGDKVLLVDDLIATGGTARASCELLRGLGAEVLACAFVIELDALRGRERLSGCEVHSLLHY